jgi:GDPmannose 4,6-dehydratase
VPTALITGITGQDGSYLAELLLAKGYAVVGLVRPGPDEPRDRIAHLADRVRLLPADLLDQRSLDDAVRDVRPHEVYNLAARSAVQTSWAHAVETGEHTALGAARVLEAVRSGAPEARYFQASSSEMFGRPAQTPQRESTPLAPRSPYGAAKAYAHYLTVTFRESFAMYAVSGILYNHESPRRGPEFVTRKITTGAAAISLGLEHELRLGNLDARRDWGFAGEYVDAMWRMLQADAPEDYVIGTGATHSVREFCQAAFGALGLDYREYVVQDERYFRPVESGLTVADPTKARERLGWSARTSFRELVEMMVESDLRRLREAR